MSSIEFSIAITTYNRLSLLRRAVESALAQTVPCEIVVADDCSSDGTEEYVRSSIESLGVGGDKRIVYHRNPSNMGHSATMNAGVAVAGGKWIKPVDDDDYLAPNCIQEMMRAIALRPEAVLCSCQAAQVDINEVEISRTRKMGPGKAFYIPQEDIHYGMLLEQIPFGTPIQVAFRRDAFIQSGGWDSGLDANFDDIDSWIKIARFGDAIFINKCLTYRTVWPGSYNQKFSLEKRLETNILIKEKIYSCVSDKHRLLIPKITEIRDYLKLHWCLVALKQGKFTTAVKFAFPSGFSPMAWKLLVEAVLSRRQHPHWRQKHLDSNLLIVAKLYTEFNQKHIASIPNLKNFQSYVKLRYSWLACRQGKFLPALRMALPAVSSLTAWKLFVKTALSDSQNQQLLIRKLVLIQF